MTGAARARPPRGLLARPACAWAALPLRRRGRHAAVLLAVAIACALLSLARLALGPTSGAAAAYLNVAAGSG